MHRIQKIKILTYKIQLPWMTYLSRRFVGITHETEEFTQEFGSWAACNHAGLWRFMASNDFTS